MSNGTEIIAPEPPPVEGPEAYGAHRPTGRSVATREASIPAMPLQMINAVITEADCAVLLTIKFDGNGGPIIENAMQALVYGKTMAADPTLPAHCHGNVGTCLSLVWKSRQWQIAPHDIAHKSYFVKGRLCFESQLIHAVVERLAPLDGRLRYEMIGEGDERRIKIIGKFKKEQEPHVYTSEPLSVLRPAKSTRPGVEARAGSPLWDRKPEVQMWYDGSRDWARMFCPDVILGVYSPEEMEAVAEPVALPPRSAASVIERLEALPQAETGFGPDTKIEEVLTDVATAAKEAAAPTPAKIVETVIDKPAAAGVKIGEPIKLSEMDASATAEQGDPAHVEDAQHATPTSDTTAKPVGEAPTPKLTEVKAPAAEPKVTEEVKPDRGTVYVNACFEIIDKAANADQLHNWWRAEAPNRKSAKLTAKMSKDLMSRYMKKTAKLEGHS